METTPDGAFPQFIETRRLRLRKPEPADEGLCARLAFDSYGARRKPLTPEGARLFGSFMVEHWSPYGFGFFILEVVEGGVSPLAVGHAGLKCLGASPGRWSETREAIELGFALVPSACGRGYATEAARATLAATFQALDVHVVHGRCDVDNTRSARVLSACGMIERERDAEHRYFSIVRGGG